MPIIAVTAQASDDLTKTKAVPKEWSLFVRLACSNPFHPNPFLIDEI